MLQLIALNVIMVLSLIFTGCSSKPKADLASTADPRTEIAQLEADLNAARRANVDVLAADEFRQSQKYLDSAKSALADGDRQSDILESLSISKGYMQKAQNISTGRQEQAVGLLEARQKTLAAGAGNHPQLQEELTNLDKDVISIADELGKTSADDLAKLQQRYITLEAQSVILRELGKAQAVVNGAKKDNAEEKAPLTFKEAEMSMKTAEASIATNVRNPAGYQSSVQKAKKDVTQLANVLRTINANGKDLAESAAVKMVAQSQSLKSADAQVKIQQAIENARSQFSPTEAEAYQQGENLVIRLKKINFASGRSDLPAQALPLLAKVADVAHGVNASQISVEGHTDSVGDASFNKTLSEQRAVAVASYFKTNGLGESQIESQGYGFEKPIATNKSKQGRAQNRRVDVIITPQIQ